MTNAEKYAEVFGLNPDTSNCPTDDCNVCPCAVKDPDIKGGIACMASRCHVWWNSEYKEGVANDV